MSLFLALAGLAVSPVRATRCSDAQIFRTAHVRRVDRSEWPNYPQGPIPDAATMAKRRAAAFDALGMRPRTVGLAVLSSIDVDWPVENCTVSIIQGGFNGVLDDGRTISIGSSDTVSLGENAPAAPAEPAHPTVKGARFISSTGIMIENWRAGLWRFSDGHSTLAAYQPGDSRAALPLMEAAKPVIGVAYLGAPDTAGGNFTIIQQIGRNSYRWSLLRWGEQAVRMSAETRSSK